jgi:hypothetical protein
MNITTLSAYLEEFLALKRTIAEADPNYDAFDRRSLRHKEKLLRNFLVFWNHHGRPWPIRAAHVLDWLAVISQRIASSQENIGIVGSPRVNTITRTRQESNLRSIGALINPATANGEIGTGDEEIGLSNDQIHQARTVHSTGRFRTFGQALRAQRDRREGLLLLYPIDKNSAPRAESELRKPLFDDPERDGCTVIGAALVFPVSDTAATIEYIVGSVGEWQDSEE